MKVNVESKNTSEMIMKQRNGFINSLVQIFPYLVRRSGGPCYKEYSTFPDDFSSKSWILSSNKECEGEELPDSHIQVYS